VGSFSNAPFTYRAMMQDAGSGNAPGRLVKQITGKTVPQNLVGLYNKYIRHLQTPTQAPAWQGPVQPPPSMPSGVTVNNPSASTGPNGNLQVTGQDPSGLLIRSDPNSPQSNDEGQQDDSMNQPVPPEPMAQGATLVTRPTVALLGERGPERVVPLNANPYNKTSMPGRYRGGNYAG